MLLNGKHSEAYYELTRFFSSI